MLHDFLVEVDLCDGRTSSHCLDICIGPWMLRDWLTATFFCTVFLLVIRLVLRLVSVEALLVLLLVLLFCLLLGVLFCLLLAVLFSVLIIISPLLDVERCSASASSLRCTSRCPRTRVALLRSSFHHWHFGCGSVSDSHHLLLGSGSVYALASWQWLCL